MSVASPGTTKGVPVSCQYHVSCCGGCHHEAACACEQHKRHTTATAARSEIFRAGNGPVHRLMRGASIALGPPCPAGRKICTLSLGGCDGQSSRGIKRI